MKKQKFEIQNEDTNIVIFGLSGSGKTSISELLAQKLNKKLIHPSVVLKQMIVSTDETSDSKDENFWNTEEGKKVFLERLKLPRNHIPDFKCDEILRDELAHTNCIMGSWSMPWLVSSDSTFKVLITCSESIRTNRVSKRSALSKLQAKKLVKMKDYETRDLYLKHKKFDIFNDYDVFHYRINVEKLSLDKITEKIIDRYYDFSWKKNKEQEEAWIKV
jgi:cytidylate kinase